jgi:hypothetical protein
MVDDDPKVSRVIEVLEEALRCMDEGDRLAFLERLRGKIDQLRKRLSEDGMRRLRNRVPPFLSPRNDTLQTPLNSLPTPDPISIALGVVHRRP